MSNDEIKSGDQRRKSPNHSDELSLLLDKIPLNDVKQSIKYMQNHLLLQNEDIKKRQELVRRMEQVLCANGLDCDLFIFGSTKNSLGLCSSLDLTGQADIDIFIQLKDSNGKPIDVTRISYSKVEHTLHRIDRILGDDQSYLELLATDQSVNDKFDLTIETICHRHMRVPITRLKIYSPSPRSVNSSTTTDSINDSSVDKFLQCDLNVSNALGIANTRLIRFLCKFEPRFFVLNVLLRYWSKYVAFLNKPDALSSYALTNMILFFFQIRNPQILPPIDYFVKLSTKPKVVNDWRCDFTKDYSRIDFRTGNTESVIQLLVGFFRFFSTFKFENWKISTRFGRTWPKPNHHNRTHHGRNRNDRDWQVPLVHIMDPFEQSHNLTARMRPQTVHQVCLQFSKAAKYYRKYL